MKYYVTLRAYNVNDNNKRNGKSWALEEWGGLAFLAGRRVKCPFCTPLPTPRWCWTNSLDREEGEIWEKGSLHAGCRLYAAYGRSLCFPNRQTGSGRWSAKPGCTSKRSLGVWGGGASTVPSPRSASIRKTNILYAENSHPLFPRVYFRLHFFVKKMANFRGGIPEKGPCMAHAYKACFF